MPGWLSQAAGPTRVALTSPNSGWGGVPLNPGEVQSSACFGKEAPLLPSRDPLLPEDRIESFVASILLFSNTRGEYDMDMSGCVTLGKLLNLSGPQFALL